ncbi:MAG: hypothetical protein EZS28_049317, partial [Streblomastix strix]
MSLHYDDLYDHPQIEQDISDILAGLTTRLWRSTAEPVELRETKPIYNRYAITVSIHPFHKYNNRIWTNYSTDDQVKILSRIEQRSRSGCPSISLAEVHYERAPQSGNMHYHAMYEMPAEYSSHMSAYFARQFNDDEQRKWRTFDIQLVRDNQLWIDYIRKSVKVQQQPRNCSGAKRAGIPQRSGGGQRYPQEVFHMVFKSRKSSHVRRRSIRSRKTTPHRSRRFKRSSRPTTAHSSAIMKDRTFVKFPITFITNAGLSSDYSADGFGMLPFQKSSYQNVSTGAQTFVFSPQYNISSSNLNMFRVLPGNSL